MKDLFKENVGLEENSLDKIQQDTQNNQDNLTQEEALLKELRQSRKDTAKDIKDASERERLANLISQLGQYAAQYASADVGSKTGFSTAGIRPITPVKFTGAAEEARERGRLTQKGLLERYNILKKESEEKRKKEELKEERRYAKELLQEEREYKKEQKQKDRDFQKELKNAEISTKKELDKLKLSKEAKKQSLDLTKELRNRLEKDPITKDTKSILQSYGKIKTSVEKPSAAGDIALIFNYMKMLDPGSTVREGEFATAAQAGGVPDRILAQYNKLLKGERLTKDQRSDFFNLSENILNSQLEIQKDLDEATIQEARDRGAIEKYSVNPAIIKIRKGLLERQKEKKYPTNIENKINKVMEANPGRSREEIVDALKKAGKLK